MNKPFIRPEGVTTSFREPVYKHDGVFRMDKLIGDEKLTQRLQERYGLDFSVVNKCDTLTAANYAEPDDDFTLHFLEQNKSQIWYPEEIPINDDRPDWNSKMSVEEKIAFQSVLGGLTLLDTIQGDIGMNKMVDMVDGHTRKALLSFMAMMENTVHAASYSTIFISLSDTVRIKEIFQWVHSDKNLQIKAKLIAKEYENMDKDDEISVFRGMVASTFLESFLFYSGFYYPLYLAGNGKMINSGEIINLIIRDEAIHGVYIGLLAQEKFNSFSPEVQAREKARAYDLLETLYANELEYTKKIYDRVGRTEDVNKFLRYNANVAMTNLGFEMPFEQEEINPIILSGLDTKVKYHDYFSSKGNGYTAATVEAVDFSKDFDFNDPEYDRV